MPPTYQTALEQLSAGEFAAALDSLNQVIQEQSTFAEAYYQRGQIQAKLGDLQGAIADYSQAIQLEPTAQAFLKRALAYLLQGEAEKAIADAHQATHLDSQLALAPHLLGKAYVQVGKKAEAIVAYKQATQRYLALQDKQNASECIAQIEALQVPSQTALLQQRQQQPLDPAVAQQFLQQANRKCDRGDAQGALLDLEWLLHLEPNHPQALCLFANVQAQLGNGQAALHAIARALQADPDSPELRLERGKVRLTLRDVRGAIAEFTQLIQHDNSNAQYYFLRGRSYMLQGDFDQAFKDCANAIGITPKNPEPYILRAIIQQELQDFEAAMSDYQQAATLWFDLGYWENQQKALAQAASLQEQIHQKKAGFATNKAIVPIKYRYGDYPAIEVVIDQQYTFDMVVDSGCGITLLTSRMATILGFQPTGRSWGRTADGRSLEFESGYVRSLTIGSCTLTDVQVAIAPEATEGILGQNVLMHFEVRMLVSEIEFHRK
jgi:tetratricopeptide (TPR) repeat protein